MGDVQLAAEEGVGDFAEAAEVEAEGQLVDVRLAGDEVARVAHQPHALALHRFLDLEGARPDAAQAEALRVLRFLGREDPGLVGRHEREEKCQRLGEMDVDGVRVLNDDPGERAAAPFQYVIRAAHVAQNPGAARLRLRQQKTEERVVYVPRLEHASVVEAHAAAEMEAVQESLLEHLPALREVGDELRAFSVAHQSGVDRLGHEAERGGGCVSGIERQFLPEHRGRGQLSALHRRGEPEPRQLLLEERGLVTERAGHLGEVRDAEVRFPRALVDDVHRLHDGRALRGQNGCRLEDGLHQAHDVLHGPADGAAAALLLAHGALEVLGVVANHRRLLADLARGLGLLLRRRGGGLDHLRHFLDGRRGGRAAAGLLLGRACDLGDRAGGAIGELEDLVEHLGRARREPDAVRHALGADGHLLGRAVDAALHVLDERTDLFGRDGRALGQIANLVGDDGEPAATLAGLRGDDGRIEREQVRLSGDVVDDPDDVADLLRALRELAERALGLVDRELDLAHPVDGSLHRGAAFVRRVGHVPRELGGLPRRVPDLLGGRIHFHHRRRGLGGERGEALRVRRHLVDRGDHFFDRRAGLLDEFGQRVGDAAHFLDRRRHLQDGGRRLLGVGGELLHRAPDVVDRLIDLRDRGRGGFGGGELFCGAARQDAGATADLVAGAGDVGGELPEAPDRALEVRDQATHRRGHPQRLRLRDDVARGERQVPAGDAVDEDDDTLAAQDHAFEPEVEEDHRHDAGGGTGQQRFPPERERDLRNEPEKEGKQQEAGNNEDPHLLSPAEVAHLHRVPDAGC